MDSTLFINEDNFHFYGSLKAEEVTVEGIKKLMDADAESAIAAGVG